MSTRRPWRITTALALTIVAALASSVRAQEAPTPTPTGHDFDVLNSDWNGLSELERLLTEAGLPIEFVEAVDLSTVTPADALVLLHPTGEVPVEELFVLMRQGGRVLLALEPVGAAQPVLEAVEMGGYPDLVPHWHLYHGNPHLPRFQVPGGQAEVDGVTQVLANHPVPLTMVQAAIIPYDDPRYGLLYRVDVGSQGGTLWVLGDASVFINFMLGLVDNRRLALNLFSGLCPPLPSTSEVSAPACHIYVVTRDVPLSGQVAIHEPPPPAAPPLLKELADVFEGSFQTVNELLAQIAEFRPHQKGVYYAAVFLALGTGVFLFAVFPLIRPRWLSFRLAGSARSRSRSEFEWHLERLLRPRGEGDYGLPLAILKDEVGDILFGALAAHSDEFPRESRWNDDSVERASKRFGERIFPQGSAQERRAAQARALAFLQSMTHIPGQKSLVGSPDGRYSERLLRRVYGEARRLLAELGVLTEYERRIGRP